MFCQIGPGKGLISGEHYIRYYISHVFGLRQTGQAWKCGLSVLDTLFNEIALVVVYRCWRGDCKPGTSVGPSLDRNHWRTTGDAEGQAQCSWQRTDKERGLPMISGLCHSQLTLLAGQQFRSETHHGHICSNSHVGSFQAAPWSNLHWAVSVHLGGIPRGSCLSAGCCWDVALQPFGWKKHYLVIQEHPSTLMAMSRKTGFELV